MRIECVNKGEKQRMLYNIDIACVTDGVDVTADDVTAVGGAKGKQTARIRRLRARRTCRYVISGEPIKSKCLTMTCKHLTECMRADRTHQVQAR